MWVQVPPWIPAMTRAFFRQERDPVSLPEATSDAPSSVDRSAGLVRRIRSVGPRAESVVACVRFSWCDEGQTPAGEPVCPHPGATVSGRLVHKNRTSVLTSLARGLRSCGCCTSSGRQNAACRQLGRTGGLDPRDRVAHRRARCRVSARCSSAVFPEPGRRLRRDCALGCGGCGLGIRIRSHVDCGGDRCCGRAEPPYALLGVDRAACVGDNDSRFSRRPPARTTSHLGSPHGHRRS